MPSNSFSLGYRNPATNEIEEVKDLSIFLYPFEVKRYTFYIYGEDITENSIISVLTYVEELTPTTQTKVSFSSYNRDSSLWTNSDSRYTDNSKEYKLDIELTNTLYTELTCKLKIDISLYKNDKIKSLSYYGDLVDGMLSRPIDPKSKRSLIIDPVPVGEVYTYISYSHGDSLILLDDNTGIPYLPEDITTTFTSWENTEE